jgi:hypothetical protein
LNIGINSPSSVVAAKLLVVGPCKQRNQIQGVWTAKIYVNYVINRNALILIIVHLSTPFSLP